MYSTPLDRANPGAILLLLDQSTSMSEPDGQKGQSKATTLANAVNLLIRTLVLQCEKGDQIRDYYDIGIIGYSGHGVSSVLDGELAGQQLVPVSAIAHHPLDLEIETMPGRSELQIERPVWVRPHAFGPTPMNEAIDLAGAILAPWANEHKTSFPPLVINITDGQSTDGDPSELASKLRNIVTMDGNLLLFNLHISTNSAKAVEYPASADGLPDEHAVRLYEMSSPLTPYMVTVGKSLGLTMADGCRGFMFNADPSQISLFLDVGTRVATSADQ